MGRSYVCLLNSLVTVKEIANTFVWTEPIVHEALATLYLRLNGYLTTGFIAHSPTKGENLGEVDCLAIRHPYHSQNEREIKPSKFLAIRENEVDLIICEAKSSVQGLRFNDSLEETLPAVLRWAGVFTESQVSGVVEDLRLHLASDVPLERARDGVVENRCRVRLLLCCPPCKEDECIGRWCLCGSELLGYVNECLNPSRRRDLCSTRYDFGLWGYALSPLVAYFKRLKKTDSPHLQDLYSHLRAKTLLVD